MTFDRSTVVAAIRAHAPRRFRPRFNDLEWRALENDGLDIGLFVVVADIRESTSLMKETVNPTGFARALHEFASGAREDASATRGWFDKFTGDGFLVYWPDVSGSAAGTRADFSLEFCRRTLVRWTAVLQRFRENVQNLPAGVGMSLGLDSGDCRLVMIGNDLTVIGSPVVGAVRMVSAAGPGEVIANVHPGEAFDRGFSDIPGLSVERITVTTKDYPSGQEAYRIKFASPRARRHK